MHRFCGLICTRKKEQALPSLDAQCGMQESDFFKKLDSDGDGLLSFQEYMLIITLLSIPDHVCTPPTCQAGIP